MFSRWLLFRFFILMKSSISITLKGVTHPPFIKRTPLFIDLKTDCRLPNPSPDRSHVVYLLGVKRIATIQVTRFTVSCLFGKMSIVMQNFVNDVFTHARTPGALIIVSRAKDRVCRGIHLIKLLVCGE